MPKVPVPELSAKLLWQAVQFDSPGAFVNPAGGPPLLARLTRLSGPIAARTRVTATIARGQDGRLMIGHSIIQHDALDDREGRQRVRRGRAARHRARRERPDVRQG